MIALGRFVGDLRGHDGNAKETAHQGLEEQETQRRIPPRKSIKDRCVYRSVVVVMCVCMYVCMYVCM
jgi:hypothetical protein